MPNWTVAVTTAPRKDCTLHYCLASIEACGWEPRVFAEPGSTKTDYPTVTNSEVLGVWHNFLNSCRWTLENTSADVILTVQDDSLFHPDSKQFAESIMWPNEDTGFVSLYTPAHYSIRPRYRTSRRPTGVNRIITNSLWGACALVWPRKVLEQFVEHRITRNWLGAPPRSRRQSVYDKRRENPHLIANSDTAIGKVMNDMGKLMYFVDPSPVRHIAVHSTIGHGDNKGRRNCLRCADPTVPLAEQVWKDAEKESHEVTSV